MRKMNKKNSRPEGISDFQRKCPELIPHLTSRPFWDAQTLEAVRIVEENFDTIKSEIMEIKAKNGEGFQPYRAPSWAESKNLAEDGVGSKSTSSGNWNVFYLSLHNLNFDRNKERAPKTTAIIESIKDQYHHTFFSALSPETHITAHNGPTNKKVSDEASEFIKTTSALLMARSFKTNGITSFHPLRSLWYVTAPHASRSVQLRIHLPLVVKGNGARMRVGDQEVRLEEGKCICFDDSYNHEAWNDDKTSRIVLIFDIWHPDLTLKERKFLGFLQNAQLKVQKKICEMEGADEDNFFSIIDKASEILNAKLGEELWA